MSGTENEVPAFKRYGVAAVGVALAFLFRFFLTPILGDYVAFALFTPAIMVAAWYGGIGPAFIASVASLLLGNYFFTRPFNHWTVPSLIDGVSSAIFLFASLVVVHLVNALRREQQRVVDESRHNLNRAEELQREMERRQEAEQLLREREERLRLIFENAHGVAILSYDLNGNINDWNEGAERVFGYSKEEILGQHCSEIFTPEDRAINYPEEELRKARENKSCADDRWHLAKGNRRICINGVTCAKCNEFGELIGYLKIARDNTEHQQAEEALHQSEWRYRKIFESAAVGIAEIDLSGRFLNANEKFCKIVEYSLAELHTRTFADLRMPEDRLQDAEDFRRLMTGEIPVIQGEKRCVCKDGSVIWSHVTASFLRDEAGNPLTCTAIVADITARKETEKNFRESEERLRLATESADIGLWHWNLATGNQEWSAIARRHLGYAGDSGASLEKFLSCLHPEDADRVKDFCYGSMRDRSFLDLEYRVIWPDKSIHWIWAKGRFLSEHADLGDIFIGVTLDITEHKLADEKLQRAVSLFRTILESTEDGILVVDLAGKVVAHNQKFAAMWRIPPAILDRKDDESLLRCVLDQLEQPEVFLQKVYELMRSEAEARDELRFKDGCVFERYSQAHRINHQIVGRVWSFRDVTARRRAEKALVRAKEQLETHALRLEERVALRTGELQKSLSDMETFLYAIAHDLRAPLRAMSGFVGLLADEYAPRLDRTALDYCKRIDDAAVKMNQLISDLLTYGRLSHIQLPIQSVDLTTEIDKVLARNAAEIENRHVAVQVDKPLPLVSADAPVLDQILENLISNAFKFVPPERIPQIHIYAEEHEDNVRLCVEDNGIGIAPENRLKIFGAFQRLHSNEEYPGTGIGLAIVQRGVEKMGGHVGVEAAPGSGCRFWVELPKSNGHKKRS